MRHRGPYLSRPPAVRAVALRVPCPSRVTLGLLVVGLSACASIPDRQYGIDTIDWAGVEQVDSEALERCLATRERDAVTLRLGFRTTSCGAPPFDDSAPAVDLWTFPWTEWPVYDPAILDVDKERILRWYRARGYYDAEVVRVEAYADGERIDSPRCPPDADCEVRLLVQVLENQPVHVTSVDLEVGGSVPTALVEQMRNSLQLAADTRFDEATYEKDKKHLLRVLRNDSHARAKVQGRVRIDRVARTAEVTYSVQPGPRCAFGRLRVEGAGELPADLVVRAAAIPEGEPYSEERIEDAERALFALGVFSSVRIEQDPQDDGDTTIELVARVQPGRLQIPSAGIGIMSGTLRRTTSDEVISVPQWDVHLRFAYEHRNVFGGMRRIRIEERPRLIMLDDFPELPQEGPRLGNVLSLVFEQPDTFEARTTLFSENQWDLGPDAFHGFFRHDIATKLGLRRAFVKQRLQARVAVQHDYYEITDPEAAPDTVSSYRLPFLEQQLRLDLRDDSRRPVLGAYLSVTAQEALRLGGYGSWRYIRLTPDVRGYVPVFWDMALAARLSLGALFVAEADAALDPTSAALGPQTYRLRGGGANGNRGFRAGELGDGIEGGTRRWEASLELRVPLGSDVGVVLFGDVGDVSEQERFRFNHLNTSTGLGLRYYTLFGALRVDAAWRVPGLQRADGGGPEPDLGVAPSALHLTIGEAF